MKRTVLAATAALALGASIYVSAQQPAGPAPAAPPAGARRGGGPPEADPRPA